MEKQSGKSKSDNLYEQIFQNSFEAILIVDDNARFWEVNSAALVLTGYSKDELLKLTIWDITPEENHAESRKVWNQFISLGSLNGEYEIVDKHGNRLITTFSAIANVVKGRHFTILKNITEQKHIEEALLDQQKETETILAKMINAFALFESVFDENGKFISYRFVKINEAYENITGVTQKEVEGKSIHEIWPETEAEWIQKYGEVAVTGETQDFELYHDPTKKIYHCIVYRPFETNEKFCVIFEDITDRKTAEKKLVESREEMGRILENSMDGILLTAPDGSIYSANPAACKIFGRTEEEICKLGREGVVDLTDPRLDMFLKTRLEKGKFRGELILLKGDGSKFPAEVSSIIFIDINGNKRTSMVVRDNTERNQAEKKIQEVSGLIEKVFASINDAIFVVELDSRKIVRSNLAIEKVFGYKPEEVIGRNTEFLHLNKEMYTKFGEMLLPALDSKGFLSTEFKMRKKNGEIFNSDHVVTEIKDESGLRKYVVSYVRDISDRINAEKKLKESEERFNIAMDASQDGIFDWNLISNEIYYSPAWKKMLGFEYNELPNDFSVWETLTEPKDVEDSWKLQQELINKKRERFVKEFKMKHKDGHWVDILSRAEAVFDSNGKAVRIVGTHTDISERKKYISALKESERKLLETQRIACMGSYVWDIKSNKWESSAVLDEIFGIDEKYKRTLDGWLNLIHPDWLEEIKNCLLGEVFSKHNLFDREFKIVNQKTESIEWVHMMGELQFDENKNPVKLYGSILKITERKVIEEELVDKNRELLLAQSIAKVGYWEYDVKSKIPKWSDELFKIYGIPKENGEPVYTDHKKYIHPDDWDLFDESVQKTIRTGEPYDIRMRVIHKDNKIVWVRAIGMPLKMEDGNVLSLYGIGLDINKIVEQEAALRESEAKFRSLAEGMDDYIMRYDRNLRHTYANPSTLKVSGMTEKEYIGKTHRELGFDPVLCDLWETKIESVFNTGKPAGAIFEWVGVDGKVYLDWKVVPEFDARGKVVSALAVSREITEIINAESELRNRMRELEIFNEAAVDRELIINDHRKEINDLLAKLGENPRYDIVE